MLLQFRSVVDGLQGGEYIHPRIPGMRPILPATTPTWGAWGTYLTFDAFRFVENIHFCANTLATKLVLLALGGATTCRPE